MQLTCHLVYDKDVHEERLLKPSCSECFPNVVMYVCDPMLPTTVNSPPH
jgi:hypothetical protein